MNNKYINKIASWDDEDYDEFETRTDRVDDANYLLKRRGAIPRIPDSALGESEALKLLDAHREASTRPNMRVSMAKGFVSGLGGAAAAGISGAAIASLINRRLVPVVAIGSALLGGVGGAVTGYKKSYTDTLRAEDNSRQVERNKYLDKLVSEYHSAKTD